ncbi:DoxX family protein [Streptomyces finlayi]|uniref:DoxX family protein n=1 Tax=Streptomyces finlayi TaxID=67296 RepID=A0A7G7BRQ1_9ACTN|nr:DoxX family protein [Streptomyces finlayi]QNE78016.1 DoxX family protein [Streptomyces finlayi]
MSATTRAAASPGDTSPAGPKRGPGAVVLTGARFLLAFFFAFSAFAKLIAHESAVESFDRMGWGAGAMYAIGGLEAAGAVALLIPLLSGVAAIGLAALSAGASIVQLTLLDPPLAVMPAVLVVVFALIARDRHHLTTRLLALLSRRA